jgi:hypothetical protein
MHYLVIYIILSINEFEVPYTVFNSQLGFTDKESCETYVKTNSNIIKNDIHSEVLKTEYTLKEILNILCLKLPMNNA